MIERKKPIVKTGANGNPLKSGTANSDAIVKFGVDSKIIQSEFYQGKTRRYNSKLMKVVDRMSRGMTKTAGACGGGADVKNSLPGFYHPEFEPSSILLPRDYREVNAWSRYFYKYDPLVSTSIDMHAELPISTIRMTLPPGRDSKKNRHIQREYEEMCSVENLDLFNKILQIGVEHFKLGNVFPFAQWSEKKSMWSRLTLLDPDFIELEKLQFTNLMRVDLIPNDMLKRIINNGPENPKTGLLFKAIPQDVRELVSSGKKIPLNTNPDNGSHVAHIAHKMADYDLMGTGIVERNFKALVYKDRLRQSQDAIAARHLTPKHLIWAENTGMGDIETIRQQVDNAFADPDYAIITNYELHWELIGTSQGLMQLDSEWNWINEELMIGLMVNKSFLLGEGSYANGQTVLEVMNQKYSIYRERLENYLIHYLFLPMAKRNDWGEYEEGTVKKGKQIRWLYPRIKWNKLNFVDDTAHKQMLSQMVTSGQVDMQTWLEAFGLDAETIKERLKRFEGTPLDVNYFQMQTGIMSEVGRALAPEIAKIKAKEMGIKMPDENQNAQFASKSDKFDKQSAAPTELKIALGGQSKIAETRDERTYDRKQRRIKRKQEDKIDELEVPLEKAQKPPRDDMKKEINLFASEETVGLPFIDTDKAEELSQEVVQEENTRKAWMDKMLNGLKFNQNARRAALNLENEILSLNGDSNTKNRLNLLATYIPQIFATKILGGSNITESVDMAKKEFAGEISKVTCDLEKKLDNVHSTKEIKKHIRSTLESAFQK